MGELNLENLKKYKDEILKAEIGALLFNLGKTHIGFWHEKNGQNYWNINFGINDEEKFKTDFKSNFGYLPFSSYKDYHEIANEINKTPFEYETEKSSLKDFIFNQKVSFPFEKEFDWIIFFKGDALKENEDGENFINKIFFRGCENINSGIDKGNPSDQLKGDLWLSNAFGSFREKVELQDLDERRIYFYNDLSYFLLSNGYDKNPNWAHIREYVVNEIKNWYSKLLSDSRFPINDVSLWDQAYMTATMFKAVLANLTIIKDSKNKLNDYKNNPNNIKWRILGIQYDKLGLAEKGYKPQQIQWYREVSKEIDDEIKKLLEYDYPIGNEIYRDETGVYFLVGEDLGVDLKDGSSLAKLKSDLKEIEGKIIDIFKTNSFDEFYPAIFLTKTSRGIMNLSYLLEKAKENFLKANWSKKERDICIEKSESGRAIGICQVCAQRLVFKSNRRDKDKNICDICYEKKTKGRIDKWLENTDKETIWMDELKDKNDGVALVTMKFELHDWLNGDMLNSLLVREEDFKNLKSDLNTLLAEVRKYYTNFLTSGNKNLRDFNSFRNLNSIKSFVKLFDKDGIQTPYEKVKRKIINLLPRKNILPPDSEDIMILDLFNRNFFHFLNVEWDNIKESNKNDKTKSVLNKNSDQIFSIDNSEIFLDKWKNYYQPEGPNLIIDIFCFAFIVGLIKNILLERSIGARWEKFIYKKLDDWDKDQNKPLKLKIDFDNRKIHWEKLDNSDIDFLSTLILQFLLRKNPSPARLRRIWESTKEFFEDIKANICAYAGIQESRRKRFYWENIKVKNANKNIPDGEYQDGDALFWAYRGKVYLISYIEDLKAGKEFNLKESKGNGNAIASVVYTDNTKFEYYQQYISIIDPTPISWQFIIPAEYVPNLIDNVMKKYYENFKFVYGKLPLHIGIVIQDYNKPLYVGIKALRKIRRDVEDTEKLTIEVKASKIKNILKCLKSEESLNNTHKYYSLYWGKHTKGYNFYIRPQDESNHYIASIDEIDDNKEITIIPNTFDFEFLDTNTRRNDIYYDEKKDNNGENKGWKRKIALKSSRPYDLETWEKFKKFKELFGKENRNGSIRSTKLQKLISVIYKKWQALVNDENQKDDDKEGIKAFFASSFVNILKLNNDKDLADGIRDLFDIDKSEKDVKIYEQLKRKMTLENIQLLLDMFEFWHTALKEV
ncbi:CRISPR-associated protein, Csx11 family [Thermoanaerobacter italicus Ab9]|uniref:CRISPR-associated protein, Csx11 family n=1 Tax=Thermoanaerobacter italicus (strain DSM 9252 / Ab9) TaxID=580331 RepID=D3T313_THEIA|nr:CRISPR-associated protein Csx11 [Thermoanaerobacter italicus]ADD02615.1 CRISPR-associated protein, Csx11 family [Thermoanaerobacter italicus Ab9]